MPIKYLDDNNPDGVVLGQTATSKVGLWGLAPVPQRTSPYENPLQGIQMGEVVNFFTTQSPASVAANTTAEQTFTVTGLATTDFVFAVNKPTAQAGLGIVNWRISAANTLAVTYSNDTASPITPSAGEVYNIMCLRGFPTVSAALTPASVAANTSAEQQFSLAPTPPVATAVINSSGQVTAINFTSSGSGYIVPPTVVIAGGGYTTTPQDIQSGTATGIGGNTAQYTAAAPGGSGATAVAVIGSTGTVASAQITNPGQGYQVAPAVSFVGGLGVAGGMALAVSKPSATAGLGIGGCRVVSNNVIAVNYINNTASPITPAAETYTMIAVNELAALSKLFTANVNIGSPGANTASSTTEVTVALNGLLTTDNVVSVQKPTFQAGMAAVPGRVGAANSLRINMVNPSGTGVTPTANEIYAIGIQRQIPQNPLNFLIAQLPPAPVAANTTAEQLFAVSGLTYINSKPGSISVNKPTNQQGLAIVGYRVASATQVGITFQNNTSAAITPTAGEWYTIMAADQPQTGTEAASYTPFTQEAAGFMFQQAIELVNELQQIATLTGLAKGG